MQSRRKWSDVYQGHACNQNGAWKMGYISKTTLHLVVIAGEISHRQSLRACSRYLSKNVPRTGQLTLKNVGQICCIECDWLSLGRSPLLVRKFIYSLQDGMVFWKVDGRIVFILISFSSYLCHCHLSLRRFRPFRTPSKSQIDFNRRFDNWFIRPN